jgi:isopentenyl-diphosphate delta-isomerase
MPAGVEPVLNPEEVMDTIWRPLATLADEVMKSPDGFTPWLQIYLREYSDLIFEDA